MDNKNTGKQILQGIFFLFLKIIKKNILVIFSNF